MAKISRRDVLRGAAATTIALPFLESIGPRLNASADPQHVPKRFVVFNRQWGTIPPKWNPSGSGRDFTLNEIMQPLAGLKAKGKLSVVTGVNMMTAHHQFSGLGHHPLGELHNLTASPTQDVNYRCVVVENGENREIPVRDYTECSGTLDILGKPGGPSIDSVIAENIWPGSKVKMLVIGSSNQSSIDMNRRLIPTIYELKTLFDTLFADAGSNAAELEVIRKRRASILDTVNEDFSRFRNRLSSRDRQRVESHFTSIREIEQRLQSASRSCAAPVARMEEQKLFEGSQVFENIKVANSLVAMGLACDVTRVASFHFHSQAASPSEWNAIDSGFEGDIHESSHAFPGETARMHSAATLHKIWMRFLVDLAEKMDADEMVEANGKTVLDNSIIFHSSDMATGHHNFKAGIGPWETGSTNEKCRGMPYLYLGGSGCGLKTNEHFVLDGANADQNNFAHGELLLTFARQCGVSEQALPSFGHPAFCEKLVHPIIA